MSDPDTEMDALVAMLEAAGLVEQYTDAEGKAAMRLTERGVPVGRAFAMAGDDADADAVPAALLERA